MCYSTTSTCSWWSVEASHSVVFFNKLSLQNVDFGTTCCPSSPWLLPPSLYLFLCVFLYNSFHSLFPLPFFGAGTILWVIHWYQSDHLCHNNDQIVKLLAQRNHPTWRNMFDITFVWKSRVRHPLNWCTLFIDSRKHFPAASLQRRNLYGCFQVLPRSAKTNLVTWYCFQIYGNLSSSLLYM